MISNLKPERVLYHFEEISKIPRNSGEEERVSNFIRDWAKEQGFLTVQDELKNLVITKPASLGYESSPSVILQAHLDMVCEKLPESNHDFTKDPILLKATGDWIVSDSGTSLGADDGIGVAMAMAILEDNTLKHPRLEAIFTVCEESTFDGANGISRDLFTGKRLINLDHAVDSQVIAGSCGGFGLDYVKNFHLQPIEGDYKALEIQVSGMKGGHSGDDINQGRGNAIEVLIRLIDTNCNLRIVRAAAGNYRLAIPRDGKLVVMVAADEEAEFCDYIYNESRAISKEYQVNTPELSIRLCPIEDFKEREALSLEDTQKVINICRLFPNGIMQMSGAVRGAVESSINMGTLEISKGNMVITAEARGAYNSTVKEIRCKLEALKKTCGGEITYYGEYSPWEYKKESKLRQITMDTYKELFGEEMEELIVHAGLECGMFIEKDPEIEAVSLGPNCQYFHSPNERMSISSTVKFYGYLLKLLENLK